MEWWIGSTNGLSVLSLLPLIWQNRSIRIPLSFPLCVCVHVCAGAYVPRGQRSLWHDFLYYSPHYVWRYNLLLTWRLLIWLDLLANEFWGSSCLCPPVLALLASTTMLFSCVCSGDWTEVMPACWHSKHVTNGAITQPLGFNFEIELSRLWSFSLWSQNMAYKQLGQTQTFSYYELLEWNVLVSLTTQLCHVMVFLKLSCERAWDV